MKAFEILSGALIEIARENIELDRERTAERESANYWHKQYESKSAECKELILEITDTTAKLKTAAATIAKLEEYIKLLEKGVASNE